mmetsp:Transcript_5612/g.12225  ORF Transcript_5612/g.12225 Transcript_5612/m.12225 type:complete len:173 (-) Transcript_5612:609-1127(-)
MARRGGRDKDVYRAAMEDEEDAEERAARRGQFGRRAGLDEEEAARRRGDFGKDGEEGERVPVAVPQFGDDYEEHDQEVNLEAFNVPLKEWIAQARTHNEIQRGEDRLTCRCRVSHLGLVSRLPRPIGLPRATPAGSRGGPPYEDRRRVTRRVGGCRRGVGATVLRHRATRRG